MLFGILMTALPEEREVFGNHWCGPDRFNHWQKVLVARYPKDPPDGDGYDCEVYETRAPARFFNLVARPSVNSVGDVQSGFTVSTSSGADKLIASIADAVARGMLSFEPRGRPAPAGGPTG